VELYFKLKPDVLLIDIRMDGMTGIDAAVKILEKDKNAKILFLTTFSDDEYIAKAFQIGAKGYILKQDFMSIIPSVKAVFMGQRVFGDEIISKFPVFADEKNKNSFNDYNLSKREIEIIKQVANGLSNREISNILFLSEGTVRNYISIILEKLNLRDRTQLAIFYYKTKDRTPY
jgi:DNA-binding NarL/FixJ family response regulator